MTTINTASSLYICMTSGLRGPETKLSDEEIVKLKNLIDQLNDPWTGSNFFGMGLSSDHFLVHVVTPDYYFYLDTNMQGYVKVTKVEAKLGSDDTAISIAPVVENEYKDTVGLWSYLAPIAHKALMEWYEENERARKEYNEKAAQGVPGYYPVYDPNEKVPGSS